MEPDVNVSQVSAPMEAVDSRAHCADRSRRRSDRTGDTRDRARILVVEHDGRAREALAVMLQEHGYDVTLASDGREATRLLAQVTPDLVVMNWPNARSFRILFVSCAAPPLAYDAHRGCQCNRGGVRR